MTLPVSGPLSLSQVQTEITGTSSTQSSLNSPSFRLLLSLGNNDAVLPSQSEFRWSQFYSKGVLRLTNSTSVSDYNLRSTANTQGYGTSYNAGLTLVVLNNSGEIKASNTNLYAFSTGSFTSGDKLLLNNSGFVIGKGGTGGQGGTYVQGYPGYCNTIATAGTSGFPGGPAINAEFKLYIDNSGTIGGGGQGGSGTSAFGACGAGGQGGAGYGDGGPGGLQAAFIDQNCSQQSGGYCSWGLPGEQTTGGDGGLGSGTAIEGWSRVTYTGSGQLLGATVN